ncbi:MAG: LLM class flavin-dependent oxidoreductase [Streptosporangiales bacterium]|nr:LLM class flavin-dependent oxidoreductase [Streptosporangiales bacterium]
MADYGHDLLFGCFLVPSAEGPEALGALARTADDIGLDLLSVQDHPYQPSFLDAWTLLSALAAQTGRIRLLPNVANLPLRPPAMLARSVASLDILSGGRVELGLGAGFLWDPIAGMGGPRRSPGEAVDALAEAIAVIRALWTPGPEVGFAGKHYQLDEARPGPFPIHPVGIWLGAYKRRMLELTGRLADGWVPTLGYASPGELVAMNRTIDAAADAAGRHPGQIRRIYNINGTFTGSGRDFLHGPPSLWIEQLTELALTAGISGFLLAPGNDAPGDLRRFAEEVAPGVREAVADARRAEAAPTAEERAGPADGEPLDDAGRSRAGRSRAAEHTDAAITGQGRISQQALVQIHDHLRGELAQLRDTVQAVAEGSANPGAARSLINRMTMRQNYWTLGAFCAAYCRVLSIHHAIEDEHMFVSLRRADEGLSPVLERLGQEHEVIAELLSDLDAALVAMVEDPGGLDAVRRAVDELSEVLLSHLAYEEDELLEPIGRYGIVI